MSKETSSFIAPDWKPPHTEEDQSHASTSKSSTFVITWSILKKSISNQVFLNVVPVRIYSKKSCVDTLAFFVKVLQPLCVMDLCSRTLELVEKKRAIPLQQ